MKLNTISKALTIFLITLTSTTLTNDINVPLIGLFTQPSSSSLSKQFFNPSDNWSFVPRSYVDWITQGGAMAIIIPFDIPSDQLDYILANIQGFVFPGGGATLFDDFNNPSPYHKRVKYVVDFAKKKNDGGVHWPIYATCLGFESLTIIMAGNDPTVMQCDFDDNGSHKVVPNDNMYDSHFWSSLGKSNIDKVFGLGNIYFSHHCGFTPEKLKGSSAFMAEAEITSVSANDQGAMFVANVESKAYPFYGSQWHAEKNQFERLGIRDLVRDIDTIRFNREIIRKIIEGTKPHAVPIGKVPGVVRKYFSTYQIMIKPGFNYYENVYLYRIYSAKNNPPAPSSRLTFDPHRTSRYNNEVSRPETEE